MKKILYLCLSLALLLTITSIAAANYVETFDSNPAWQFWYFSPTSGYSGTSNTWVSSGGNPGGYASGAVGPSSAPLAYSIQPGSGFSAFNASVGDAITADFKITGTVDSPDPIVRFFIADSTQSTYWVTSSWNPNDDTNWTTHQSNLNTSVFSLWGSGTTSFADTIANIGEIGLFFTEEGTVQGGDGQGFWSNVGATLSVDNFGTIVPIPGAVWLLGSGLICMVGIRRKFKN